MKNIFSFLIIVCLFSITTHAQIASIGNSVWGNANGDGLVYASMAIKDSINAGASPDTIFLSGTFTRPKLWAITASGIPENSKIVYKGEGIDKTIIQAFTKEQLASGTAKWGDANNLFIYLTGNIEIHFVDLTIKNVYNALGADEVDHNHSSAISIGNDVDAYFKNVRFTNCNLNDIGAAVKLSSGADRFVMENCIVDSCTAGANSVVYLANTTNDNALFVNIKNTVFKNNESLSGNGAAALYVYETNTTSTVNLDLERCFFYKNLGYAHGQSVKIQNTVTANVYNCTFAYNEQSSQEGANVTADWFCHGETSKSNFYNTLFYGSSKAGVTAFNAIYPFGGAMLSYENISMENCIVGSQKGVNADSLRALSINSIVSKDMLLTDLVLNDDVTDNELIPPLNSIALDAGKVMSPYTDVFYGTAPDIGAFECQTPLALGLPYTSHMVIQRNTEAKLWGWTEADIVVTVDASWSNGLEAEVVSDSSGYFETFLYTPDAGGPYAITIIAGHMTRTLSDVLSGEVWLGSGQSNMAFNLQSVENATEEIANSSYPNLRLFDVAKYASSMPLVDGPVPYSAGWQVSAPMTSFDFSAVGYFFGREIMQNLNIPVGIIGSAYPASSGEAWMQKEYYARMYCDTETRREYATGVKDVAEHAYPQSMPCGLYNGMIAPLIKFPIEGVIWYQGENNSGRAISYRSLLPLLIQNWRDRWEINLPFYIAQLSAFATSTIDFSYIRESQYIVSQNIFQTGMSNTIDIGDSTNVHAKNKQDVGFRLGQLALSDVYGEDIVKSGPLYSGHTLEENKIKIGFEPGTFSGMELRESSRNPFLIRGDGDFVEAQAQVIGDSVELWAEGIDQPVEARYCFERFPEPNLYNEAGLPAVPFRTNQTIWTEICVTKKSNTSATVRLLGKSVAGLTKDAFVIIDNRTKFADRLLLNSATSEDAGHTYTLQGDFSNFSDGWIYIQEELTTSGAPVPFDVTTKEYEADVITFSIDQTSTWIDAEQGIIYVASEEGVDLSQVSPQYMLSDGANADVSSSINLNDVYVFYVTAEYGNRKKWTVVKTGYLPLSFPQNVKTSSVQVSPSCIVDYALLTGLELGDRYALYDLKGNCLKNEVATKDKVVLDYVDLKAGVYLVSVDNYPTMKTIKR